MRVFDVARTERLVFGGCERYDLALLGGVPSPRLPDHRFFARETRFNTYPNPHAEVTWGCACGEEFVEVYRPDMGPWPECLNHGTAPDVPTIPIVRVC